MCITHRQEEYFWTLLVIWKCVVLVKTNKKPNFSKTFTLWLVTRKCILLVITHKEILLYIFPCDKVYSSCHKSQGTKFPLYFSTCLMKEYFINILVTTHKEILLRLYLTLSQGRIFSWGFSSTGSSNFTALHKLLLIFLDKKHLLVSWSLPRLSRVRPFLASLLSYMRERERER